MIIFQLQKQYKKQKNTKETKSTKNTKSTKDTKSTKKTKSTKETKSTKDTKSPETKAIETKVIDPKIPDTKAIDTKRIPAEPKRIDDPMKGLKVLPTKIINGTLPTTGVPKGADRKINTKILSSASIHGDGDSRSHSKGTGDNTMSNIIEQIKEAPVEVVLYLAPFVAISLFVMALWIFKRKKSTSHKMNKVLMELDEEERMYENNKAANIVPLWGDEIVEKSLTDSTNGILMDEQLFRIGNGENIEDVRGDNKYKVNKLIIPTYSPGSVSLDDSPSTLHENKNEYSFSIPIYTLDGDIQNNSKVEDNKSFKTMCSNDANAININNCQVTNDNHGNDHTQINKKKNIFKNIFSKKKSKKQSGKEDYITQSKTINVLEPTIGLPPVSVTQFTNRNNQKIEDGYNFRNMPSLSNNNYATTNGTNNTEITMLNHTSSTKSHSSSLNCTPKSILSTAQSEQTIYEHNSNPRSQDRHNSIVSNSNKSSVIELYGIPPTHEIKIKEKSSEVLNNELDSNRIFNKFNVW
jgi:hypothetical protein